MTSWQHITHEMSEIVRPETLDALAAAYTAAGVDLRAVVLEQTERYGVDHRFGRTLRLIENFRGADGTRLLLSAAALRGAFRFMYEGQREDIPDEDMEGLLRDMLPGGSPETAETMLGAIAGAEDTDTIKGIARFGHMMKEMEKR